MYKPSKNSVWVQWRTHIFWGKNNHWLWVFYGWVLASKMGPYLRGCKCVRYVEMCVCQGGGGWVPFGSSWLGVFLFSPQTMALGTVMKWQFWEVRRHNVTCLVSISQGNQEKERQWDWQTMGEFERGFLRSLIVHGQRFICGALSPWCLLSFKFILFSQLCYLFWDNHRALCSGQK